jgi:hypothetical protein
MKRGAQDTGRAHAVVRRRTEGEACGGEWICRPCGMMTDGVGAGEVEPSKEIGLVLTWCG